MFAPARVRSLQRPRKPMRALAIALLAALAACQPPEASSAYRLVTVNGLQSLGIGMRLRELPHATLARLDLGYGLAVIEANEAARRAGLRVGDVVYAVDQVSVHDLQEFRAAIEHARADGFSLVVRRGGMDFF